jgi:hypothetical protein
MALIQTVDSSELYHMACKMGRGDNFSYNGWQAIGDYLEEISNNTGEDMEVDIIAICCEYAMAESVEDAFMQFDHEHGIDLPTMEEWQELDEEEKLETIEEFLQHESSVVICEDDLIIWQAF